MKQSDVIGRPSPTSWDELEANCLTTFAGGHHDPERLGAFQHGMRTVFNLLRNEFPPMGYCKLLTLKDRNEKQVNIGDHIEFHYFGFNGSETEHIVTGYLGFREWGFTIEDLKGMHRCECDVCSPHSENWIYIAHIGGAHEESITLIEP